MRRNGHTKGCARFLAPALASKGLTHVITNFQIYRAIAMDAFEIVKSEDAVRRRPKPDGSPGCIITPDPEQKSFKQAMVCVVFAGMWYEALLHLVMVDRFGERTANEWKHRSYRNKFEKVGCADQLILDQIQQFADSRNALVHEEAYWNQDSITTAQREAVRAIEFMNTVDSFINAMPSGQEGGADGHT